MSSSTYKGLLIVVLSFILQSANANWLEGSIVFSIHPQNVDELKIVNNLESRLDGVDIWQYGQIQGDEAKVFVPKAVLPQFYKLLDSFQIKYQVSIDDVHAVLSESYNRSTEARNKSIREDGQINFKAYHSHAEINAYLDRLQKDNSEHVTLKTLGKSSEGKDIKAIVISSGGENKPVFMSDAGIHAREWLAPSTALYMIKQLVENSANSELVHKMDWVIVPLLNPDGYEHSRRSILNRLWRKTRSKVASEICPGVDGNRNFDYKWLTTGASSNKCSDIYAGPQPHSEPEIQYMANLMKEYKDRTVVYLAIHSHGSYIIHPFAHDGSAPANIVELKKAGAIMADAINAAATPTSKKYAVGTAGELLKYYASGASDDYAIGNISIPLAFTLELPSGESALGFHMSEDKIERHVDDTWKGVDALAKYLLG